MTTLESCDERLEMLSTYCGSGTVKAVTDDGDFTCIFDRTALDIGVGLVDIKDKRTEIVCTEADATRLGLRRDVRIRIEGEGEFRIRDRNDRPADLGPGFTRLSLAVP